MHRSDAGHDHSRRRASRRRGDQGHTESVNWWGRPRPVRTATWFVACAGLRGLRRRTCTSSRCPRASWAPLATPAPSLCVPVVSATSCSRSVQVRLVNTRRVRRRRPTSRSLPATRPPSPEPDPEQGTEISSGRSTFARVVNYTYSGVHFGLLIALAAGRSLPDLRHHGAGQLRPRGAGVLRRHRGTVVQRPSGSAGFKLPLVVATPAAVLVGMPPSATCRIASSGAG